MWAGSGKVAVVGLGHSRVLRNDDGLPEHRLGRLAGDAVQMAAADAGVKLEDIDGIAAAPMQPFEGAGDVDGVNKVTSVALQDELRGNGLKNVKWTDDTGRMIGHALPNAAEAVANGKAQYAIVIRALGNPKGVRYGHGGANAQAEVGGAGAFSVPYGNSGSAGFAILYQRYLWKYNQTRDKMATFAVHERKYGLMYPNGFWAQNRPEPLTREDYLTSRMITDPLCLYDCDIPVQGVAAFLVTSSDHAKDSKQPPVYILGYGHTGPVPGATGGLSRVETQEFSAGQMQTFLKESSGMDPKDASVINVYDGYTCIAPIWAEGLGLCKPGEFLDFIQNGNIEANGNRPMNTSSGNQGGGRMHGVPHYYDSVEQIRGQAGKRQVQGAETAVACVGPQMMGQAMVFAKSPK